MSEGLEIIRADSALRRRYQLVIAGLILGLVLVGATVGDPIQMLLDAVKEWFQSTHIAHIEELEKADPAAAAAYGRKVLFVLVAILWLICFFMALPLAIWGAQLWRAEQWPRPGTRVLRDTVIVRGPALRRRAAIYFAAAALIFVISSLMAVRIATLLIPDNTLQRDAPSAAKSGSLGAPELEDDL